MTFVRLIQFKSANPNLPQCVSLELTMIQPKDQELRSTGPNSVWEAMLQVLLYCLGIISPVDTLIRSTRLDDLHRKREPRTQGLSSKCHE